MKTKPNKAPRKEAAKKMLERVDLAVKHEFYLEASWILSALFERKVARILEKGPEHLQVGSLTFLQMLKRLKSMDTAAEQGAAKDGIPASLSDDIRNWKNQRNELFRDMPEVHVSQARIERLAIEGLRLYKELAGAAKSLKAAKR